MPLQESGFDVSKWVSEKDEQQQIQDHPLLTYIFPNRFAEIKETYEFPFPKGFKR